MGRGKGFEFCCCAIPLVNVGAYAIVLEVALVSFLLGVLSFATHAIIAGEGVIPPFAKIIVAVLAFITFLWQIFGIVTIRIEAISLYHTYVRISTLLTLAIIGVTTAFAVLSAVRHSTAQTSCVANYGALPSASSTGGFSSSLGQNSGSQICNYFLWAQTGVMFGLIVFLGLIQLYMCFASRAYGVAQRSAARDFKAGYRQPDEEIPLSSRNMPNVSDYDARGSSPIWEESTRRQGEEAVSSSRTQQPTPHSAYYDTGTSSYNLSTEPNGAADAETAWTKDYNNTTGYPAYVGGGAPAQATQHGTYAGYPAYESRPN